MEIDCIVWDQMEETTINVTKTLKIQKLLQDIGIATIIQPPTC